MKYLFLILALAACSTSYPGLECRGNGVHEQYSPGGYMITGDKLTIPKSQPMPYGKGVACYDKGERV